MRFRQSISSLLKSLIEMMSLPLNDSSLTNLYAITPIDWLFF